MILGGVRFEGERGLAGNSDADIVAHVCCDAILGAAGLGDIGQMFPDTDPALKGADSIELLRRAADAVRAAGWHPGNIDLSVVLDRPKLVSVKDAMQRNLSDAAGCPVTITGRRTEGVGAFDEAKVSPRGCCPGSSMSARGRNSKPQPKGGRGRPVKNTAKGRGKGQGKGQPNRPRRGDGQRGTTRSVRLTRVVVAATWAVIRSRVVTPCESCSWPEPAAPAR